VNFLRKIFF